MANILDDLKAALSSFESSVKSDLEEIRSQKLEVLRLKNEITDTANGVNYVRNDGTVIISAPNIIIGNVDKQGNLLGQGGGSRVVIRANSVAVEGVGSDIVGGSIVQRAASIRSIAVDPGVDGMENVVCDRSEIVCQAKGIALQADNDEAAFVSSAGTSLGISLLTDTAIQLNATPACKSKMAVIDQEMTTIDSQAGNLNSQMRSVKNDVEKAIADITRLIDQQTELNDSEEHLRSSQPDLSEMHDQYVVLEQQLLDAVSHHIRLIAQLAELNRRKDALKLIKQELSDNSSQFKKASTGSFIAMNSEVVGIRSVDGDGNLRDNPEAGLYVKSPHIGLYSTDRKGQLVEGGSVSVNAQSVGISTASAKLDAKQEKGDIDAIGDVTIISRTLNVQAIDRKMENKKIEEKALTKDGKITFRAENITAEAADTEGKSTGRIQLNAHDIRVASMNLDKEQRTFKELAADSQMVLTADNMFVGSSSNDSAATLVQVAADKVAVMAATTAEMQQGDGKAVVTLDSGNLTAGSGKNQLSGDTTIAGKAEIKGETTAPSGKFDSLDAAKSFTSPNISDGMAMPSPASPAKPSAKLKQQEAKK